MISTAVEVPRFTRVFHGRTDQVRQARLEVARYLSASGCPVTDDVTLVVSEFATNAVIFFPLSSCVVMAAIGGQVDLRPALSDYLFLAAACCGTYETGQPPQQRRPTATWMPPNTATAERSPPFCLP
jgi:hypothetical protein